MTDMKNSLGLNSNAQEESKYVKKNENDLPLLLITEEMFECSLCHQLLMEPVTTSCGHSYCKGCILRALDHDNRCPLCRTVIHISPDHGVSVMLQQMILANFPLQYQARKDELDKELGSQKDSLPLFVLSSLVLFPNQPLPLHVFEPRYRLMIRRCLESGKKFGIVSNINNQLSSCGTAALIESQYLFPDGRSLLATLGTDRFRILDTWDRDGYKVARIEYFEDDQISPERIILVEEKFNMLKEICLNNFVSLLPAVEKKFGKMPSDNYKLFAWWLCAFIPADTKFKQGLLETLDVELRFDLLIKMALSLDPSRVATCNIS